LEINALAAFNMSRKPPVPIKRTGCVECRDIWTCSGRRTFFPCRETYTSSLVVQPVAWSLLQNMEIIIFENVLINSEVI
jgi:hypothetical protein